MTTPVSNIPVSVDYTSRDYYSLRDALIRRVKDRTGNRWAGNDPSDFGVALVESFAYMGDLVNYYIDRIANESYIGTATQRQNVLNLASMLGYTAGGYTSATVNVTLVTTDGYKGQIGGSELTGGTARLAIPNDNVTADPGLEVGDRVNVSGLPRSEYNGTFTITNKPAVNEIEYVPAAFTVTAVGNGSIVTYTTSVTHNLLIGEIITVSGFTGGSVDYNLANQTITGVTATTFTVASTLSGSTTGSGTVKYADITLAISVLGYVHNVGYTTVPAGTQIFAEISSASGTVSQVIFTTLSQAVIPFVNDDGTSGSVSVLTRHGLDVATLGQNQASTELTPDINGELLGYSTGEADQSLSLLETEVDTSTVNIYIENGNEFELWSAVQYLEDQGPTDKVYRISIDADYNVFIEFGDGVGGVIPTKDARIKASYYKGSGLTGNIPVGAVSSIYDVPGATSDVKTRIMSKVSASNNSAATGGDEPESLNSIRNNAPSALRALTRAVTLEDFSNLALSIPRVGKANSTATLPTSVVVYVAPERSVLNPEITPGIEAGVATTDLTLLKSEVADFLSDKSQIGTTVTVVDPIYTYVHVEASYTRNSSYAVLAIETAIKENILDTYSYNNSNFASTITPQNIEKSLRQISGIEDVKVTKLYRHNGDGKNVLAGAVNELFVFTSDYIVLSSASSDATLDSLTLNGGGALTLTPVFNPGIYSYTTSTSNATVTVTPSVADGQTITVSNKATADAGSQIITLSTGLNFIPISVTAADGITTNNYTVVVSKT